MSPESKNEYTAIIVKRYRRARFSKKTAILNEYCQTTGYHRKHAIRKLNNFKLFTNPKKKSGRPRIYNSPEVMKVLTKIWHTANLPCGKRLKPIAALWLNAYQKMYGHLSMPTIKSITQISSATLDRLFKSKKLKSRKRGLSATRSGTLLRKQIPIQTNQWDQSQPGFVESDTVHHCGESMAGQYVVTLNCTDIASTWSEQRAVWTKGEEGIFNQIKDVEKSLPFPLLGFDSDNGGEFINRNLFEYFTKRPSKVLFTRSRAYHTQDNAHIEQKNNTHIRQWLGYDRFDNNSIVPLLNDLFRNEWRLFHNFFCPSVKLIEKKRIGSQIIKRYDAPKTPYQRLLESNINPLIKQKLKEQYESLNPFQLKDMIEFKIKKVFNLVNNR